MFMTASTGTITTRMMMTYPSMLSIFVSTESLSSAFNASRASILSRRAAT